DLYCRGRLTGLLLGPQSTSGCSICSIQLPPRQFGAQFCGNELICFFLMKSMTPFPLMTPAGASDEDGVRRIPRLGQVRLIAPFRRRRFGRTPPPKGGSMTDESRDGLTYAQAGVDIDAGNRMVDLIKPLVRATARAGADAEIGGFGGLFDLKRAGFRDP